MGKYTVAQLKQWHASTNFGKDTIQNSKLLGCFHCLKTYTPSSIKAYLDSDQWGGQGPLPAQVRSTGWFQQCLQGHADLSPGRPVWRA